jgi:AAA domain, putative AbiEii toxin, Type IV TA system/AAA ATPase domain
MRISSFRIENYKSFANSGPVNLSSGMNIVTGQNNAGKTALLQALSLEFEWSEHRSLTTTTTDGITTPTRSLIEFEVDISGKELAELTQGVPDLRFSIPNNPGSGRPHPLGIATQGQFFDPINLRAVWDWIINRQNICFSLSRSNTAGSVAHSATRTPSHDLYPTESVTGYPTLIRTFGPTREMIFQIAHSAQPTDLGIAIWHLLSRQIYRFSAERFALGVAVVGTSTILVGNAANLPEVLNMLQPNPERFRKYVDLVRYVLPQVKWISIVSIPDNRLQINIWNIENTSMRSDLAIPLNESGTGIGQVLAIIYVAFASQQSRVLFIDEPQSFLHPGAARKLIEVLKSFPQHQYVVSTHSPSIISAADPVELLILRNEEGQSKIEVADARDSQVLKSFLDEIGAKLADVFGMDQVIWVEGPTEALALPCLVRKILSNGAAGTAVIAVRSTGDLEGKNAERIFRIYRDLTAKASLLPPSIAFVLDGESRTAEQKRNINSLSGGKAYFIPRRTFENYLLVPAAISAIANAIDGFTDGDTLAIETVEQYLETALSNESYWSPHAVPQEPTTANADLNGALLIASAPGDRQGVTGESPVQ